MKPEMYIEIDENGDKYINVTHPHVSTELAICLGSSWNRRFYEVEDVGYNDVPISSSVKKVTLTGEELAKVRDFIFNLVANREKRDSLKEQIDSLVDQVDDLNGQIKELKKELANVD